MRSRSRRLILFWLTVQAIPGYLFSGQTLSPADIMEKYGKAVVLISGIKNSEEIGLGSGFIVKGDGVIVTNYHVIAGAYPAIVKTKNGDIYEDISVIDFNERYDIAIIKIKGFDLPTVILGNSNTVKIGERVVVIGNPHGLENTISDGLLSQIRNSGEGYSLHQISSPISAGSSGSPVFNQRGEVIGIATLSDTDGQNLNFSVPINYARGLVEGPVKYSLKEFVGIEKEPTILSEGKRKDVLDNKKALERINIFITTLYSILEDSIEGYAKTSEPHLKRFNINKYRIDPLVYSANQSLNVLIKDLRAFYPADVDLLPLKETLLSISSLMQESSTTLVAALERIISDGSPTYGATKGWSAILAMNKSTEKFDKDFAAIFIDKVRSDNPSLEADIIIYILETYKNKDKSATEIADENRKSGHMGIAFRGTSNIPIVLSVNTKGPADRAKIQRGDIFLGVVNGPKFKSLADIFAFQRTTKPGETHVFIISRDGKTIRAAVKLE